jgi:hypothetical protein
VRRGADGARSLRVGALTTGVPRIVHTCRFNIPEQCRLPMSESDLAVGKKLLEEDFIQANPACVPNLACSKPARRPR